MTPEEKLQWMSLWANMERRISEKLADEVIKNTDLAAFAKELAPKLLKVVEAQMIESVKEIEWDDFIYELIGTEAVGKELTKRIVAALAAKVGSTEMLCGTGRDSTKETETWATEQTS